MLARSQESYQHKLPTLLQLTNPHKSLIVFPSRISWNHPNYPKLICYVKYSGTLIGVSGAFVLPDTLPGSGLQNAILPGRFLRLRGEVLEIAAHVAATLHLHRRLFGLTTKPCRGTPLVRAVTFKDHAPFPSFHYPVVLKIEILSSKLEFFLWCLHVSFQKSKPSSARF